MEEYLCWRPEYDEDVNAKRVMAYRPQSAAELAQEEWCHRDAEYPSGVTVHVRGPGGDETAWVVDVESVPVFVARRAK